VLGPKAADAEPEARHRDDERRRGREGGQGRPVEYRVEKAGIIHSGIGKASFPAEDLRANFDALLDALVKAKPSGAKGKYVRKIAISSTMGPGVKIDPAVVAA
jgi:large subunit ribosomal protein L1